MFDFMFILYFWQDTLLEPTTKTQNREKIDEIKNPWKVLV